MQFITTATVMLFSIFTASVAAHDCGRICGDWKACLAAAVADPSAIW